MGAYLDQPVTEKNPQPGQNKQYNWGACAMQGWRCGMEDAHIAFQVKDDEAMIFGVFDGHGGKEVAQYCQENFKKVFEEQLKKQTKKNYEEVLKQTFMLVDDQVKDTEFGEMTGTTANVVLISQEEIICVNSGDSRSVLCRGGKAVGLSEDHKPQNAGELRRIEAAGHMVEDDRVDGNLALSRAIGDFQYKDNIKLPPEQQAVTCYPDITRQARAPDDEFIIVACDGIWDCKTNDNCVDFLKNQIKNVKPDNVCPAVENLLDDCLASDTSDGVGTDNMTAILIQIRK